jgi:tetratricopeptide (TPR) repeat protein
MAMVVSAAEDFAHGADLIEAALTEAGDDPRARAEALSVGAILDVNTNQLERAEARTAEARQLFERIGDAEGVARTVDAQAMAILGHGNILQAVDMLDQVARLFLDSGMLLRVGTTRAYRAFALVWMERPQEALEEVEEALRLEQMLGHHDVVLCIGVKALALLGLGRIEESKVLATDGLIMARELGHRGFTAVALLILGTVSRAAGDIQGAEGFFRESLEEGQGMPVYSSWAAAQLARCLIERGELAEAERYTAEAMHKAGLPLTHYELRLAQAELAVARQDPDALTVARQALALAELGGHPSRASRLRQLVATSAPQQ